MWHKALSIQDLLSLARPEITDKIRWRSHRFGVFFGIFETAQPAQPGGKRAAAIERLLADRLRKLADDPTWLDPKAREDRILTALAKERERKREAALAKAGETTPPTRGQQIPPQYKPMTDRWAVKLDQQERWIAQARADTARIQEKYAAPERAVLIGGGPYERRWW